MPRVLATRVHGKGTASSAQLDFTERLLKFGDGRFATVELWQIDGPERRLVALKRVHGNTPTNGTTSDSDGAPADCPTQSQLFGEIDVLKKVHHQNCVTLLYYYWITPGTPADGYNLILDYLPKEIGKILKASRNGFGLQNTKILSWQLFNALAYLSSMHIIHLDIKPANLIFDETTMQLKIADFGNARIINYDVPHISYQVTRYYRPPELLFGSRRFTCGIDVWSAGCVMAEMATGKVLFRATSTKLQANLVVAVLGYPSEDDLKTMNVGRPRVRKGNKLGLLKHLPQIPKDMVPLLERILVYSLKQRIPAHKILAGYAIR
ncbi:unnamed protein product, partial [Mesorhabditis spiculigera]